MASANGHVNVLNWWKKSGFRLIYDHRAIDYASHNGHIKVLDWWLSSGLDFEYKNALTLASNNEQIQVLNWWVDTLPKRFCNYAKYTNHNDDYTCNRCNEYQKCECIIKWLREIQMPDTIDAMQTTQTYVYEQWKQSQLALCYDNQIIDNAVEKGQINVLEWWFNSGLRIRYSLSLCELASKNGRTDILDWLKQKGIETAIETAIEINQKNENII